MIDFLSPIGMAVETVGSAIGLSPELKAGAKIAAGVMTGDLVAVGSGASTLASNAASQQAGSPVQTEVHRARGAPPSGYACGTAPPGDRAPGGKSFLAIMISIAQSCSAPPPPPPPPGRGGEPTSASRGPSTGASEAQGAAQGSTDPNIAEYRRSLAVLKENWATFDTAAGVRDGLVSRADLERLRDNPTSHGQLREAAQFLLDHPEYFSRLEMAAGVGGRDGIVGMIDVDAELRRTPGTSKGAGGSKESDGPGSTGPAQTGSKDLSAIIDDPNLSLEEKIQLVLSKLMEQLDAEIMETMDAQAKAADGKGGGKAGGTDEAAGHKSKANAEKLQLKLQQLMERRKQMFELMTNMSMKFNEMAKAAISNLGRA